VLAGGLLGSLDLRDEFLKVVGVSAIARDISARKIAEEAVPKANETSVYASPIPIVGVDAEGRVTIWNAAAEDVFGWKECEVIGKPNPVIPEDQAGEAAALYQQLFSGKTLTGVEVHRRRKDGELVTISLSATPLWDENHKVRGILKFLADITEQKRAEESLRAAEENYRSIFETPSKVSFRLHPKADMFPRTPRWRACWALIRRRT
jgi:PAS domain S-box-containing protein